jgi:hypothetical protein
MRREVSPETLLPISMIARLIQGVSPPPVAPSHNTSHVHTQPYYPLPILEALVERQQHDVSRRTLGGVQPRCGSSSFPNYPNSVRPRAQPNFFFPSRFPKPTRTSTTKPPTSASRIDSIRAELARDVGALTDTRSLSEGMAARAGL